MNRRQHRNSSSNVVVGSALHLSRSRRGFLSAVAAFAVALPSAARQAQANATLAGFQQLRGGRSRLFVRLTASPMFEVLSAPGRLDYLLKETQVSLRNNRNPLVLTHFDTPVERAQLLKRGGDVVFRLEMKRAAEPAHEIVRLQDGGFSLRIEFS